MTPFRAIFGAVCLFFFAIIALTVVFGSWFTVDQGTRGILLRNGAVTGVAEPGLGFKTPWVEDVVEIDVRSQSRSYEGMATYSKDQQTAMLTVSVNYRIPADQVTEVYTNYGSLETLQSRLLDRKVYEETKTVFGRFNAVAAIQERGRLNAEVVAAIQKGVRGPIIIESVQIENIDFSKAYEASIEARMQAEVEVQKLKQNAEREKVQAEIVVTQAKAQAESTLAKAKAEAEAITLRGNAQAQAIAARAKALADNPALVALTQAERWDGKLPSTMLPNSAVPMLGVK